MSARSTQRPIALRRGDTVGIVSPGFAVKEAALRRGLDALGKMGFRTRVGDHALARNGYLAGTDEQRLADLLTMLDDPEVRAIWFARGGYGTARLLERVPWRRLARGARLLIGYSDLTALFAAALPRTGWSCLYGPVVTELGDSAAYHRPSLRTLLAGRPLELPLKRGAVLAPGRARGRLVGGNLSVLCHLSGTRYFPDLRGAVLFLEETGEEVYRIDRMLTQLRLSGTLSGVAAVLLGSIDALPRKRFPPARSLDAVLAETFLPLGVPVVGGLQAGHVGRKRTLPLGAVTTVDTGSGSVRFEP
jgi:muramoyltetrapeptide carboxypeptidase